MNEAMPITPSPTPNPMPIAVPVVIPEEELELDWPGSVLLDAGDCNMCDVVKVRPLDVELADMNVTDGLDVIDDRCVDEYEYTEEEGCVEDGKRVDEDEGLDVVELSTSMFHPTTAIAPTMELRVSVVVAVFQVSDRPKAVDANVNVIPEDTSDRHSPSTEPSSPFAR